MGIPQKLYKYESFNELSLRNLKRQAIYFSSPRGFNDPYDCAITAEIDDIKVEQIDSFKKYFLGKKNISAQDRITLDSYPSIDLNEIIKRNASAAINSFRDDFVSKSGIYCLSETNDDLLMWSHYGGKYKGFCLEFESQYEPFNKARKVKYSNFMPKINPLPILMDQKDEKLDDQFIDLFCTKSESWGYEKEWRVLHNEVGTSFHYVPEALTGIYFGPEIAPECIEIIALIIMGQNESVKFFRGKRSTSAFKVEFEEFNYTPYNVAKKLGLLK